MHRINPGTILQAVNDQEIWIDDYMGKYFLVVKRTQFEFFIYDYISGLIICYSDYEISDFNIIG